MLIILNSPNFLFFELSSAEKITELESHNSRVKACCNNTHFPLKNIISLISVALGDGLFTEHTAQGK